eukprot:363070-Chlamydomonas_euryale.AAC.6
MALVRPLSGPRVKQYVRFSRFCRTYGTRYGTVPLYARMGGGRGTGCGRWVWTDILYKYLASVPGMRILPRSCA